MILSINVYEPHYYIYSYKQTPVLHILYKLWEASQETGEVSYRGSGKQPRR